jgi:hypothetical protein
MEQTWKDHEISFHTQVLSYLLALKLETPAPSSSDDIMSKTGSQTEL